MDGVQRKASDTRHKQPAPVLLPLLRGKQQTWEEKGQHTIHAATLGIPCVVRDCVVTAMKP